MGLAGERAFALCWAQAGAGKRLRACAEPKTRHLHGGVALQGARHGEAIVRAAAEHRSCSVPITGVAYGLRHLAQKDQGVGVVLTVRGIGRGSGIAVLAARSWSGARAELGEEGARVALRASRSHAKLRRLSVGDLRWCSGG